MKYDYFVAGRTRNRDQILAVLTTLRGAGKKVYCFLDNTYENDNFAFSPEIDAEQSMQQFEAVENWRQDSGFQRIYKQDMDGLREAAAFIVVFPAGLSAHMEIGVAYGMGKKCYAIGSFEKPEPLYLMIDECFDTADNLLEHLT